MKLVRVHNPSRIAIAKKKGKKMAARRRKKTTKRRRRVTRVTVNPRRRRRHARRRNPVIVARTVRRRRRFGRRRSNPSALRVGQLAKDAIYGAGGAILTRAGAQILTNFVPSVGSFSVYAEPVIQAAVAAVPVRMLGTKFLGKQQGDVMMIGGLISAGLALFDKVLPGVQQSIVGVASFNPIQPAPGAAIPVQGSGLGDVYDVNLQEAGFGALGDVEDVDMMQFQ